MKTIIILSIMLAVIGLAFLLRGITHELYFKKQNQTKESPASAEKESTAITVEITEDEMKFSLSLKALGLKVDNDEGEQ